MRDVGMEGVCAEGTKRGTEVRREEVSKGRREGVSE